MKQTTCFDFMGRSVRIIRRPLLVPAGGTQQQGLGMEKLNGPNSPWSRILPSQG